MPHARISGGISNVSFSFRGNEPMREAIHTVFLYYAIREGLTMGIVNAGQLGVYAEIPPAMRDLVEDVVLDRPQPVGRTDPADERTPTERLVAFADTVKGSGARRERTSPGVHSRSKSGLRMRWCMASPRSSSRTPRKFASRSPIGAEGRSK